ncbi:MAG: hypothetical protein QMC24_00115, partial [Akkermansiaceae bacterium]
SIINKPKNLLATKTGPLQFHLKELLRFLSSETAILNVVEYYSSLLPLEKGAAISERGGLMIRRCAKSWIFYSTE